MKIVMPNERPVSWNKIYESRHWIFRKNLASSVHRKVIRRLEEMGYRPLDKTKMFTKPVEIDVTAYFKNRPLDADNIGAASITPFAPLGASSPSNNAKYFLVTSASALLENWFLSCQ